MPLDVISPKTPLKLLSFSVVCLDGIDQTYITGLVLLDGFDFFYYRRLLNIAKSMDMNMVMQGTWAQEDSEK